MDFEFSDEQEELRTTVRRLLEDHAPTSWVREQADNRRGTTDAMWKQLAELGLLGLLVPEAAGGIGGSVLDAGVVLEEMGRALHPGPYLASSVTAAGLLADVAADTETDLLAAIAEGTSTAALALLEPGRRYRWQLPADRGSPEAGPGPDAHTMRAEETGDGGWQLTGTKTRVPYGDTVDTLLVTADADGELGLFAVEADADGVDRQPEPTMDGTRHWAQVRLDGAPSRRLGAGDASGAIERAVDRTAVASVTDGVGAAEAVLAMSVEYAGEREQFGRPVGSFQAVQHLCADMLTDVELARAGAYYALWACDEADDAERHRAATLAKAFASDALARVGATGIQVHGGIGFTAEHDVGLYYTRLRTMQHELGGTGEHLDELADLVI